MMGLSKGADSFEGGSDSYALPLVALMREQGVQPLRFLWSFSRLRGLGFDFFNIIFALILLCQCDLVQDVGTIHDLCLLQTASGNLFLNYE